MKVLLDTHVFLWALSDPNKISPKGADLFKNTSNELYLSLGSYWEICIKVALGKLKLIPDWQNLIEKEMEINGILWLPISKTHCEAIIDLPTHHRDPFDRLLVAQAIAEQMSLLTADQNIAKYAVDTIW